MECGAATRGTIPRLRPQRSTNNVVKPAICIQDLSKLYRLGANIGGYRTLSEKIYASAAPPWLHLLRSGTGSRSSSSPNNLWALHNVSLDIQPGEVVGVIGRNGAG